MKIPYLDKLVILFLGVSLTVGILVFRSSLSQNKQAEAMPQYPIDPLSLDGSYNPHETTGEYLGESVDVPSVEETTTLSQAEAEQSVLGVNDEQKRIEVDLTTQRLYAFEGDQKVYDFLISSGKWGRTPTGEFRIWGKFKYAKMSGGQGSTYYYLPNVPFIMYFANDEIPAYRGFGLHGTYWHDNFGHPMSHGCINMKTEEAEQLFYWAQPTTEDKNYTRASDENPGTRIIIYGKAPLE